jgi:hypothetical protein
MSSKHPVKSTGDTPGKPKAKLCKKHSKSSRKSLFSTEKKLPDSESLVWKEWTTKELEGLVQHVALFNKTDSNEWPTIKCPIYWGNCAEAVKQYSGESTLRSGRLILYSK